MTTAELATGTTAGKPFEPSFRVPVGCLRPRRIEDRGQTACPRLLFNPATFFRAPSSRSLGRLCRAARARPVMQRSRPRATGPCQVRELMSSQPHTLLPWVIRRTRLPLLSLRCADCRSESATTGAGRFRVNANGNLLDVWLLVRCVSCDRTSKLTVHERAPVRSFDPDELDGYHASDPELVASRLLDPLLARRNRFTLDWTGAWRLDVPSVWRAEVWPVTVQVAFEEPVPVRPDRLIAQGLGLSRNQALRRIKCDTPLRRANCAGYTLTALDGQE